METNLLVWNSTNRGHAMCSYHEKSYVPDDLPLQLRIAAVDCGSHERKEYSGKKKWPRISISLCIIEQHMDILSSDAERVDSTAFLEPPIRNEILRTSSFLVRSQDFF